jgi:MFS family permease
MTSPTEVWVASIYSTVVSCLVLTAATVGDVIGRRQVFAAGVFVLGVGSLVVAVVVTRLDPARASRRSRHAAGCGPFLCGRLIDGAAYQLI